MLLEQIHAVEGYTASFTDESAKAFVASVNSAGGSSPGRVHVVLRVFDASMCSEQRQVPEHLAADIALEGRVTAMDAGV